MKLLKWRSVSARGKVSGVTRRASPAGEAGAAPAGGANAPPPITTAITAKSSGRVISVSRAREAVRGFDVDSGFSRVRPHFLQTCNSQAIRSLSCPAKAGIQARPAAAQTGIETVGLCAISIAVLSDF